jgi:hypothetical protein
VLATGGVHIYRLYNRPVTKPFYFTHRFFFKLCVLSLSLSQWAVVSFH